MANKMLTTEKFSFQCKGCGNCCAGGEGYIWLTREEQTEISEALKIPLEKFLKKYTKNINGRISLIEFQNSKNDYWCIFLDKNRKCKIYEHRPKQCRTYPYWKEIMDDDEYLKLNAEICNGIILNNKY